LNRKSSPESAYLHDFLIRAFGESVHSDYIEASIASFAAVPVASGQAESEDSATEYWAAHIVVATKAAADLSVGSAKPPAAAAFVFEQELIVLAEFVAQPVFIGYC